MGMTTIHFYQCSCSLIPFTLIKITRFFRLMRRPLFPSRLFPQVEDSFEHVLLASPLTSFHHTSPLLHPTCSYRFETRVVSHLYTWQDSRCSPEFLASLPTPRAHQALATGYGCATLIWFAKYKPGELNK